MKNPILPPDPPTTEVSENKPQPPLIPEEAFLLLSGIKVIPLTRAIITIGRRLENDIVIDDMRVSRTHAQLQAIHGRYVMFDLNSSGGTFINDEKVSQGVLFPGDIVSLGGFIFVFGQYDPPPRLDLKETDELK